MKLADVEKMAFSCRRRMSSSGTGYPVVITRIDGGKGNSKVAVYIFEEPGNCNFKGTAYWAHAFFKDSKRLYVIYGTKQKGHKVRPSKNKIGSIQFCDDEFRQALDNYSSEKRMSFNWKWDSECGRPYIELA